VIRASTAPSRTNPTDSNDLRKLAPAAAPAWHMVAPVTGVDDETDLRILGVEPDVEFAGVHRLTLRANHGRLPMILHSAPKTDKVAVCASSAQMLTRG